MFEYSTPLSYSSFTHYILAVNRRAQFTFPHFRSIRVFSVKKVDSIANFAAGGIINRITHSI
jgi:hypothetical protein